MYKMDSLWKATVQHRELSSVLCGNLEGCDGEWEVQEGGDICICILIGRTDAEVEVPILWPPDANR